MPELRIFNVQALLTMIQHPMSCIKIADHHTFVLCYLLEKPCVHLMILPHLKNVDDLSQIIPRALYYLFQCCLGDFKILFKCDTAQPLNDLFLSGFQKLEIQAMVDQRCQLLIHSIIANADNGCFGLFNYCN